MRVAGFRYNCFRFSLSGFAAMIMVLGGGIDSLKLKQIAILLFGVLIVCAFLGVRLLGIGFCGVASWP